jgi:hypothetical protein
VRHNEKRAGSAGHGARRAEPEHVGACDWLAASTLRRTTDLGRWAR